MAVQHRAEREALIAAANAMAGLGINQGTAGNLSVRVPEGLLITPSGAEYATLQADDIVFLDPRGRPAGRLAPSSEWRFHVDILGARPAAGAVVHTHSVHATALACLGRPIPAFHYMVAAAGGADIRCADYATFGTQALSDAALRALQGREACLLAHHGVIALGATLTQALKLAAEVETLARMYLAALAVGEPAVLDAAEMQRVVQKFRGYGVPPGAAAAG